MKRAEFFDGQDVAVEDYNFMESERVAEVQQRFDEIASSPGILAGLGLSNPSAYVVRIATGVAYDDLGRDIRQGPSFFDLSISAGDVGRFVTAAWISTETTPVDHPETTTPTKTRIESSQTFQVRVAPALHEVILGTIATVDGSGNVTFDVSSRQYWGALLTPQMVADINEAIFSAHTHQQFDHVSGIEHIGSGGNPGAIAIDSGATPDEAVISDTVVGDSILIDGHRLVDAARFSNRRLTFDPAGVGAFPQVWAVSVDSLGAVDKTLVAQYPAQAVVTGVQIADIAPFGVPYPSPLVIEHYVVTGTHFLRLNGQSARVGSSGLYLLRRDADPDLAVLVSVTAGALPALGTIGSPISDTIVTHPEAFVDPTPPADPSPYGQTLLMADESMLLGFLMWSGNILNLLGYGTWNASGSAYDKRNFGNLDDHQISDAFKARLTRLLSETRADGFVTAPALPTSAGLAITINANAEVDRAYLGGRRVSVPRNVSLTLPPNVTSKVCLTDNDDGTSLWGAVTATGVRGVTVSGQMPVWNVTTDGSAVTAIEKVFVCLPDLDRQAALIGRPNLGTLELQHLVADSELNTPEVVVNTTEAISGTGDADTKQRWLFFSLGAQKVRGYIDAGKNVELTVNAKWANGSAPNGWTKDVNGQQAFLFRFGVNAGGAGGAYFARRNSDSAWANGAWDREQAAISDILKLGAGLLSTAAAASAPRIWVPRAITGTSPRTEIMLFDQTILGEGIRVYRSEYFGVEALEIAFGCQWLSTVWTTDNVPSPTDAGIVRITRKGLRYAKMSATGAATPWADNAWDFGDPLFQLFWDTTYDNTTAFKNTLAHANIPKVLALLSFDGTGGVPAISPGLGFNAISPVYVGTDFVQITFPAAFALATGWSADVIVESTTRMKIFAGGAVPQWAVGQVALKTATTLKFSLKATDIAGIVGLNHADGNDFIGVVNVKCYGAQ